MKIDEKTIGKSMVFDGPKPLKSIEKQTLFLILGHSKKTMKKRCRRGPQKSCFGVQNCDMGFPVSTYHLIFDVLVRCPKIIIFGRLPDGPKNRKNRALGRQGQKRHPGEFLDSITRPGRGVEGGTAGMLLY